MHVRRAQIGRLDAFAPHVVPCHEQISKMSKFFYIILFILFLGILGMSIAYINDRYTETYSSFRHVRRELSKIKLQMEGMKEDVQLVLSQKTESGAKSQEMDALLVEMKKIAANQDKSKCETKPEAKSVKGGSKETPVGDNLQQAMRQAINEYDADKTGRSDFALESAGGRIVALKNCENYRQMTGFMYYILLPILPLCPANDARLMIQPGTLPGQCWAFKGDKCSVILKLLGPVNIDSVSMEHLRNDMSPTGDICTAPKDFKIFGLKSSTDTPGVLLGDFCYAKDKSSLQNFPIKTGLTQSFEYIEMKVESNHGNPDYTCVYRLRVHGKLNQTASAT